MRVSTEEQVRKETFLQRERSVGILGISDKERERIKASERERDAES